MVDIHSNVDYRHKIFNKCQAVDNSIRGFALHFFEVVLRSSQCLVSLFDRVLNGPCRMR
jgi:hypothetical protein